MTASSGRNPRLRIVFFRGIRNILRGIIYVVPGEIVEKSEIGLSSLMPLFRGFAIPFRRLFLVEFHKRAGIVAIHENEGPVVTLAERVLRFDMAPGDLPDSEIEAGSPALQADSLPSEP